MKKLVSLFVVTVFFCVFCMQSFALEVDPGYDYDRFRGQDITLNVYNWGEYISDGEDGSMDVIQEFEDLTGIKVNYTTYDTNETMYAKIRSGGGDYDVIIPSDYMIGRMANEGLLEELNMDNIPNFKYIIDSLSLIHILS